MKKLLFLCSKNKLRSPTAEAVFCDVDGWQIASAGISRDAEVRISVEDIEWADIIFVMEKVHKRKLVEKFGGVIKNQKVISLDIPDNYAYMDRVLVDLLQSKVPLLVR